MTHGGFAANEPAHVSHLQANCDATAAGAAGGKLPTGRARVRLLYEEYVHLPLLRQASVDVQSLVQSLERAPRSCGAAQSAVLAQGQTAVCLPLP